MDAHGPWKLEYARPSFERFFRKLAPYEQAVLAAALKQVLSVHGPDICQGEWGKPFGAGLYEFRVRRSLRAILSETREDSAKRIPAADRLVLIRVFCAFSGDRVVILLHGYDKLRDPSSRRQQKEIEHARKLLRQWKAQN